MSLSGNNGRLLGVEIAQRLGLSLSRREGHDFAGPCIACKSSDAFRLHERSGVGHCFSCQGKWSPFQVAETVLQDREQAKALLVEMGIFEPRANGTSAGAAIDPVEAIARQKGITSDALRAFGAKAGSSQSINLPVYGPNGKPCSTFSLSANGGKGLFAARKKAGLFFPHVDGKVRLPKPGEVWHLVEGPKDAAALHALGFLACGMNSCRLAGKFARLFRDVQIVLIPDRDKAGEEGADSSARVLRGVTTSIRIAVLPAEFKETKGEDVRDILRRSDGREQLLQAIADAKPPDWWDHEQEDDQNNDPTTALAETAIPEGDPLKLRVSSSSGKLQRIVVATRGEIEHRDRINTDSSTSRDRFIKKLSTKLGIDPIVLAPLIDTQLTKLAAEVDENYMAPGDDNDDKSKSQATSAVEMTTDCDLWHTPGKDAFATIPLNGHNETWAVKSQTFKRYLAKRFYDQTGEAMSSDALKATVNLLEAQALFDGVEHPVFVRLAEHDGNIYLDLCNETWQVIEITSNGWQVIDESPVRFRRSKSMLALPAPERGGSINLLRKFLNVTENTWVLLVAWLVAAFRPRGPYPLLALFAEHGSGKSTGGRFLRDLFDPNVSPLRAEPKDARDLMIAANNAWCLAFDNLSYLPPWLSDALIGVGAGKGVLLVAKKLVARKIVG